MLRPITTLAGGDVRVLNSGRSVFFILLIAVHLIPIWAFIYFPSEDGPAHLNNANVLREYHHPERSVFREYYVLNWRPVPNWFSHIVMAGLMSFVPPLIAEKMLLSGYVILLPMSIAYVLRTIRPGTESFAFLAFPLIYNYPFQKGFYNFSYSLPMCFFMIGYWLKYQARFTLRTAVRLGLLSLVLYFCHLVSLVMAYTAIAFLGVWFTALDLTSQLYERQRDYRAIWKTLRTRILIPVVVLLPALFLGGLFFLNSPVKGTKMAPFWDALKELLNMASLVSLEPRLVWLARAYTGLFALFGSAILVLKIVQRRWNRWDGLLVVVLVYVVMYFMASDSMGYFMQSRLRLYPFLMLIPWLAAQAYDLHIKKVIRPIQGIAIAMSLILLGVHMERYAILNDYLREYLSGMHLIEPNTTLLPLSFSYTGHDSKGRGLASKVGPFHFASGYIAAERHIVNFDNYEANTDFFPVMFRPKLNPFYHIMDFLRRPLAWTSTGEGDFLTYPQRTGGQVDYVLIWDLRDEQRANELTQSLLRQLEQGFELLYTSPQRGLMQLYRRKNWRSSRTSMPNRVLLSSPEPIRNVY